MSKNTPANWGKDHWSTFGYVETRCVDYGGVLQNEKMRCHGRRHPLFLSRKGFGQPHGDQYPTRLKDGELKHHDDLDCLWDLQTHGLLEIRSPREATLWVVAEGKRGPIKYRDQLRTKELTVKVRLTDLGRRMAHELRAHLQRRHNFGTFEPTFAPMLVEDTS